LNSQVSLTQNNPDLYYFLFSSKSKLPQLYNYKALTS
jgi:hypothetical protein